MYSTIRRNLTFYFVQYSPAFLIPSHPIIAEVRFNKRKRATRFRQASLREALAPLHRLQRSFLSIPFPPSITRSRQGKNKKEKRNWSLQLTTNPSQLPKIIDFEKIVGAGTSQWFFSSLRAQFPITHFPTFSHKLYFSLNEKANPNACRGVEGTDDPSEIDNKAKNVKGGSYLQAHGSLGRP